MNSPVTPIESTEAQRGSAQVAVQVRNRQQAQISKHEVRTDGLTIGRGWHCDVILTDSAADAVHATLLIDSNGHWLLRDADSTNGTRVNGIALSSKQNHAIVASGDTITIGRTRITLYDPDHPVAAARSPSLVDNARDILSNPGWALLITAFCLGITVFLRYLEQTGQYKPDQLVTDLLAVGSVGVAFTLFWTVVSKLVRGEANLLAIWSLGMLSVAVAAVSTDLIEWLSFNLQSLMAHTWLQAIASLVILFASLLLALAFTTNLRKRSRLWVALVPPVILLFVNTLMPMFDEDKPVNWPPAMLISRPPALQLVAPTAVEKYLQDSQDLFSQTQTTAAQATKAAQTQAAEEVLTQ